MSARSSLCSAVCADGSAGDDWDWPKAQIARHATSAARVPRARREEGSRVTPGIILGTKSAGCGWRAALRQMRTARVKRRACAAGLATLLTVVAGCDGFFVNQNSGGGTTASGDYVYVANQGTSTVSGFSVGSSGLAGIAGSPFQLSFVPSAVAVNPTNMMLFVSGVNGGTGFIASYSIGGDGALTLMKTNGVGLANPISMDVSPDGQWLLGLDGNGLTVDEYQINTSNGALTLGNGQVYTIQGATVTPRALKISPGGDLVFAAIGTGGDLVFPFNTTNGVLSAPSRLALPANVSDNGLAVTRNGSTLYIARSGTGGGLAAYTVSSGGTLQLISGYPVSAGTQPFSVAVNGDGSAVYVANQLDGTISGYSISSSGAATPSSGSPYANGSGPTLLAVDRTGKYLLAISHAGSPDLTQYSFDATTPGKLNPLASTSTGTNPTSPVGLAVTH